VWVEVGGVGVRGWLGNGGGYSPLGYRGVIFSAASTWRFQVSRDSSSLTNAFSLNSCAASLLSSSALAPSSHAICSSYNSIARRFPTLCFLNSRRHDKASSFNPLSSL